MTMTTPPQAARSSLEKNILRRKASLTEHEAAFLHGLLVDSPVIESANSKDTTNDAFAAKHHEHIARAAKVLDDDILFSTPFEEKPTPVPPRSKRSQIMSIGLWRAHEDGVAPSTLIKKGSSLMAEQERTNQMNGVNEVKKRDTERTESSGDGEQDRDDLDGEEEAANADGEAESDDDAISIKSDEEVRDETAADDEHTKASSWDMSEGGFDHYNAWEVLKDEYAGDFGFDYSDKGQNDEFDNPSGTFRILGTSADDKSAQPHVLSPPIMEALLSFVPDSVANDNYWLRFSLVRDGAALSTLKRYARAAPYTILAIETTKGEVFGSFTTSPWRNHLGYYGSGRSAFLWKLRHNRLTPCHSLFEQAQMENEIDVYCYSGLNTYVQLCTNERLAVGGGGLDTSGAEDHQDVSMFPVSFDESENFGFGLSVDEDLLQGTSSPCVTFRNPCLANHSSKGGTFEIVNLEVWSFTPCYTVDEAQKLELSQFFVQESILSNASSRSSTKGGRNFSNEDINQDAFYRRVGEHDESEVDRVGWQYAMMMSQGGAHNPMRSPNIGR